MSALPLATGAGNEGCGTFLGAWVGTMCAAIGTWELLIAGAAHYEPPPIARVARSRVRCKARRGGMSICVESWRTPCIDVSVRPTAFLTAYVPSSTHQPDLGVIARSVSTHCSPSASPWAA